MGIYKILLKNYWLLLVTICFVGCKQEKATKALQNIVKKEKVNPSVSYPKYLTKNYVLGKFDYTKNDDFTIVPKNLSSKKIYLRKEVVKAFLELQKKAKKEGINFKIISGTRNFNHQKRIWNYKWNVKYKNLPPLKRVKKILEYSAMPSTSRHHWGTDIDINSLTNSYFSKEKGLREYEWLLKNASAFGFYQVYTSKENGRTGYEEEKWHWTFLPLSKLYLHYYNKHITTSDITNFKGAEFAAEIHIISKYVNGINPKIKE